jgi:hypothetical protein
MHFNELDNQTRQRLIDVQQAGEALRAVRADLRRRFAGSLEWKSRGNRDYLYRRMGKVEKALGPRSAETEAAQAAAAEERQAGLRQTLEGMARVNRAMGLGRVPRLVGRILRRLDEAGVLGQQVCVVGTNALFAYEAHAGLRFDGGLLATNDIDIALAARRNLGLASRLMPDGLLGLLRKVDPTFGPLADASFRAVNASGLMVDLITPEPRDRMTRAPGRKRRLGGSAANAVVKDMEAVEVPRLEMIVDAPRFSATAVAEDGLPVWIAAADPRWWAAHKLWLATEPGRDPLKRQRDRDQGRAVASMLAGFWDTVDVSDETLASIPVPVRRALRDAIGTELNEPPPEW